MSIKFFRIWLISLSIILFIPAYSAQPALPITNNQCSQFVKPGNPGHVDLYLCRDGYITGYDYQTKQPSWVAFKLTGKSVTNKIKRHDKFSADEAVPKQYRAELNDYSHSGYDRGHLAAYSSMDFSKHSAEESFLLSNMSPQTAQLNRGIWKYLESDVRFWAVAMQEIYVYTGPIYKKKKPQKFIGNGVAVPNYFFKIIYAPKQKKAIAFVMPNIKKIKDKKVENYRVSIKNIEDRTGLKFLTNLPANERELLINNVSNMWRTKYN
jgi:endonuclease G